MFLDFWILISMECNPEQPALKNGDEQTNSCLQQTDKHAKLSCHSKVARYRSNIFRYENLQFQPASAVSCDVNMNNIPRPFSFVISHCHQRARTVHLTDIWFRACMRIEFRFFLLNQPSVLWNPWKYKIIVNVSNFVVIFHDYLSHLLLVSSIKLLFLLSFEFLIHFLTFSNKVIISFFLNSSTK